MNPKIAIGKYNLSGRLLKRYNSIAEAMRCNNISYAPVYRDLRGMTKQARDKHRNYIFQYLSKIETSQQKKQGKEEKEGHFYICIKCGRFYRIINGIQAKQNMQNISETTSDNFHIAQSHECGHVSQPILHGVKEKAKKGERVIIHSKFDKKKVTVKHGNFSGFW